MENGPVFDLCLALSLHEFHHYRFSFWWDTNWAKQAVKASLCDCLGSKFGVFNFQWEAMQASLLKWNGTLVCSKNFYSWLICKLLWCYFASCHAWWSHQMVFVKNRKDWTWRHTASKTTGFSQSFERKLRRVRYSVFIFIVWAVESTLLP